MLNLIGEKYGLLTVLKEAEKTTTRRWLCRCECGNEKVIRQSDLRSGKTISCGCYGKQKRAEANKKIQEERRENPKPYIDLTGQKFSRLTVLEFDLEYTKEQNKIKQSHFSYWKCQCDCGNIITALGVSLTNGNKQSCGCLQKEVSSKVMKELIQPLSVVSKTAKIEGQKFGKLTVLSLDIEKSGKGNRSFWICQCECGKTKSIAYNSLVTGATKSCGCLGNSVGEYTIEQILIANNIDYEKEVKFEDLKDETYLRFDFAIYDKSHNLIKLIEYNGRQHSDPTSIWYTKKVLLHDQMKIDYCKEKGIDLMIIPYQDLNKLDLEYLKL